MKLTEGFNLLATAPDGIKRLRELILSLAVQGKLVPQDPNDEPASELLKQIRAEKQRLIADGKIKKDKPLPVISDDDKPFELPEGWEWALLGDVINVIRGITFPANEKTREPATGRIACLRTTNVQAAIEWDDLLYVDRSFMGREEQVIQLHDIVMSMANSRELVGKVAIINSIPVGEATFGGFLSVLRPHLVSAQYAMIILRTEYARNSLIDSASQTTNIANISLAKLRPLPVPLPPLAEQSRIIAKVEELMALCDALETRGQLEAEQHARLTATLFDALAASESAHQLQENWAKLAASFDLVLDRPQAVDALEQTLLQLAVRGLLVPQDPADEPASELLKQIRAEKDRLILEGKIKKDKPLPAISDEEKPFDLPQGWAWVRLPELAQFIDYRGKTPNKKEAGIPLITAKNVRKGHISREPQEFISEADYPKWMTRGFPKVGDILFTTEAPLGNVAVVDIEAPFALAQRVICFGLYEPRTSLMLKSILLSQFFQDAIADQASGVTAQGIKSARLQLILIPLPPLAEQSRIIARVEALRALCGQLRQQLAASRQTQAHLAEALVAQT